MPRVKKKKKVIELSPPRVRERKRIGCANSHSLIRSPIAPSSPESIHFEEAEMVEQNNLNFSNYATPKLDGLQHKDPNNHILNFLEICDTLKHNCVSDDAIRLRLFPFSLKDKAKIWLHCLPEGSITTWEGLTQHFLTKYFLPKKSAKLRNDITSFVHFDNESFEEAWERFNDFLHKLLQVKRDAPIILGEPFLATSNTLIDVQKDELTMSVKDEQVRFNVSNSTGPPKENEKCLKVETMKERVNKATVDRELKDHYIDKGNSAEILN
ncbi:uncharacterized protein G2W53_007951 [Senna tora]|uniref:Retrotransposon gag domain-containing protein n=1 Tax=Senna tora TaxID=362788 RepID=A0A834X7E3_9FABA|nr:uncharacterized protein G2W53_007951 [Senna tora]